MAFCRNCGALINNSAGICPKCGTVDSYSYSYNIPLQPVMPKATSGSAITSLVLGIIGVIINFIPYIGATVNVIGLVFGVRANKISKSGIGTAGFILSLIGLVLSVLFFIYFVSNLNAKPKEIIYYA